MTQEVRDGKSRPIVCLRNVTKTYTRGEEAVHVLDGLDFDVEVGSFEALMGPSGSGKTTLLNLIAGLDRPSSGSVEVADKRLDGLGEGALAKWRSNTDWLRVSVVQSASRAHRARKRRTPSSSDPPRWG